jgi:amidase
VLDHNPCGSSSGSGTAVAANLAAASLGTETDGSIVCPSSHNSLVGIKTTLGLTSRSGVVPIAHSQDVTGPMARTVADAATLLGPMTGVDPRDPATAASRGHRHRDYRRFLDDDIAAYLSELGNTSMRILADLIVFNEANPDPELRWFGQEIFLQSQATGGTADPAYAEALATSRRLATQGIDRTLARFDLDAIVSLTNSPPWTTDLVNGDHFLTASSTPAAVAGYPNITVPAGYSFGELPVGINFIGSRWSEPTLIKLASGFEQGTRVRHAPRFLPTLGVEEFLPRDTGTGKGRPATAAQPSRPRRRSEPSSSQQRVAGL